METLLLILLSVLVVSLISFVGIFTLSTGDRKVKEFVFLIVSFAAGTMLAGAFFDLLPEAAELGTSMQNIFFYALTGVVVFFLVESFIHMYHCHSGRHGPHEFRHAPVAYLSLIADSMHNFLDGVAIAISFLAGIEVGIAVTIAVIAHEIPQEIGDFGILIYSGFDKIKALAFNFLSALTAFLGAIVAYFFSTAMGTGLASFLLAFSGGGFLYMASANLIPELHKEENINRFAMQVVLLLLGITLIYFVTTLE